MPDAARRRAERRRRNDPGVREREREKDRESAREKDRARQSEREREREKERESESKRKRDRVPRVPDAARRLEPRGRRHASGVLSLSLKHESGLDCLMCASTNLTSTV